MGRRSSSDSEEGGRKDRSSGGRTNRHRRAARSRSRSSSTRSSSSNSSSSLNRRRSVKSKNRSKSPSGSSRSRNRRSRSGSSDRYQRSSRSKRTTRSRRSRSRSSGRTQSYSKGQQRSRQSRSPSIQEIYVKIEKSEGSKATVVKNELNKSLKTPEELLKIKMQMALKAAADADAMLREKGVLSAVKQERGGIIDLEKPIKSEKPISMSEQINRAVTIDEINSDGFRQQEFKTGRSITTTNSMQNSQIDDHDIIIFGSNAETNVLTESAVQTAATNPNLLEENLGQVGHENLYMDVAAKQERWIRRLYSMRQKKLNGEAMA